MSRPQSFIDLHLTLYQLAVNFEGELDVRAVGFDIPNKDALVTAVRIIPGDTDSDIAAAVIIDTNEGLFGWVINKSVMLTAVKLFGSPSIACHRPAHLAPSFVTAKIGTLASVGPLVVEEEMQGINMVTISLLLTLVSL